jgi:hypothetical protein
MDDDEGRKGYALANMSERREWSCECARTGTTSGVGL